MQRATAIVRLTSLASTHTRPFIPIAVSRTNLPPRSGSKKCFGSSRLGMWVSDRKKSQTVAILSAHFETAANYKAAFKFSETFSFPRLSIEALELWFHVLVRQRNSCIYQRPDLAYVSQMQRIILETNLEIRFVAFCCAFEGEPVKIGRMGGTNIDPIIFSDPLHNLSDDQLLRGWDVLVWVSTIMHSRPQFIPCANLTLSTIYFDWPSDSTPQLWSR